MMRKVLNLFFITILFQTQYLIAQELNANVQIITPRLTNGDPNILQNLKNNLSNYLNNTQWTNEMWKPEERIQCSFIINISSWDAASGYQATAQVISKRPVFGSSYTTTLLNINDLHFNFSYTDGQIMNFSMQNSGGDNITTLLAFYAYIIIGVDRDSFVEKGGTPFYNKAVTILNNSQVTGGDGWNPGVTRNRYWLLTNLNSPEMDNFRKYIYLYHRDGLDKMSENFPQGQKNISKSLELLKNLNIQRNNAIFFSSYCTAKSKEIAACLTTANQDDKLNAYNILSQADPANIFTYDALKRTNTGVFSQIKTNEQKEKQEFSFEKPEIPSF